MSDIRTAADLEQIRSAPSSGVAADISKAVSRLRAERLIPGAVPGESIAAAYRALRKLDEGLTNQELYIKLRAMESEDLRAFLDLVARLWLTCPAESVVESMASAAKNVFGMNRSLHHENAAKELTVRWNGPDVQHSDSLIESVIKRNPRLNNFVRASIRQAAEGTVIARYKAEKSSQTYLFR